MFPVPQTKPIGNFLRWYLNTNFARNLNIFPSLAWSLPCVKMLHIFSWVFYILQRAETGIEQHVQLGFGHQIRVSGGPGTAPRKMPSENNYNSDEVIQGH